MTLPLAHSTNHCWVADAALEAMNGQYLMNRPLSLSYAFKKDTRGERHGTPAERLLAAQVRAGGEQLLGKVSGWLAGWRCLCVPAPLSCTRGCRRLLTSTQQHSCSPPSGPCHTCRSNPRRSVAAGPTPCLPRGLSRRRRGG
jgi:hypothetical protein